MRADKAKLKQASIDELYLERSNIDLELNEASWGISYARYKELSEYRKEVQNEIASRGYF
jgi:nucleotidyltransferase/DNA polymerase involved in DNA repair